VRSIRPVTGPDLGRAADHRKVRKLRRRVSARRPTLDFVRNIRAQSAVEALRRSVAWQATVRRDGHAVSLPDDQVVLVQPRPDGGQHPAQPITVGQLLPTAHDVFAPPVLPALAVALVPRLGVVPS